MQCTDRFMHNYTRSTGDNNKVVDCSFQKLAELSLANRLLPKLKLF